MHAPLPLRNITGNLFAAGQSFFFLLLDLSGAVSTLDLVIRIAAETAGIRASRRMGWSNFGRFSFLFVCTCAFLFWIMGHRD